MTERSNDREGGDHGIVVEHTIVFDHTSLSLHIKMERESDENAVVSNDDIVTYPKCLECTVLLDDHSVSNEDVWIVPPTIESSMSSHE